jgi:3-methylcrotonyl-CoA carboxylase alpha subunit
MAAAAPRTLRRVLIANRGEIACRIARTCRAMGIGTVAIFSDADERALHVAACDQAVRVGPAPSRDSYLAIDRVVAAARATACDAVHPGYGFLSENAAFARACADAGLTFIGPTPEVIDSLGSKERARDIARRAGVPVLDAYTPEQAAGGQAPFPLLLKASAGGGGKGMRIVREAGELAAALESARRESLAAFGDDTIIIERYLEGARHVEVQILGDTHGNLVHLHERECTVQRRHQKILEETPSPAVSPELRARMTGAALAIARAVGYHSAGTVEMMLAADGSFYFLEVNTRLQVEHPVTEMVTGVDLVREQIRIAEGHALSFRQEDLEQRGHAVEVRLYAEDPEQGFLPAGGALVAWRAPDLPGLRVDTGVAAGSEVPTHYDPMLAKIACHAPTRAEALARLAGALDQLVALGVTTNRELLARLLRHPEMVAGRLDTHFLEKHRADLFGHAAPADESERAIAAVALAAARRRAILPDVPAGWRNNAPAAPRARARLAPDGDLLVEDDAGVVRRFTVASEGGSHHVHADGRDHLIDDRERFPDRRAAASAGGLTAPMPSRVVKVLVAEGDLCQRGQTLLILEAMKMEHAVRADATCRVRRLFVAEGDPVDAGAPLVALDPADADPQEGA